MTDHPLQQNLGKLDASRRLVKWSVELNEFDIEYQPRTAIKGQTVADFIIEFTASVCQEEAPKPRWWQVYVNGSSTHEAGKVGIVIEIPKEERIEFGIKLEYSPTNNEAEYEALIAGLHMAELLGGRCLNVYSDSQLVVGQVTRNFEARDERMTTYLKRALEVKRLFEAFEIQHLLRDQMPELMH